MEDFNQNQRARKWLTLVHTGLTHLITRACATGRQPTTPQTNEWACISRELPCNTLTMELVHMLNNKNEDKIKLYSDGPNAFALDRSIGVPAHIIELFTSYRRLERVDQRKHRGANSSIKTI